MTHISLMHWEIFLDTIGLYCCVVTVLYLLILRRKFASKRPVPKRNRQVAAAGASPVILATPPEDDIPFSTILTSARDDCNNDYQTVHAAGMSEPADDPYDEVRRLLDMGTGLKQISEMVSIPRCEIELIAKLHRIESTSESGHENEVIRRSKLA